MRGVAVLSDGSPYLTGRIHTFPYKYTCKACKMPSVLSQLDWNRLPSVKQEEIDNVTTEDPTTHKDFRAMTKAVSES